MLPKYLSLVTAAALALSLCACGSKNAPESNVAPSPTQEPQTPTQAATAPRFEEQVLVNSESLAVTLTDAKEDSIWGYTLKARLENKTEKSLMFTIENASVNGYMCDPFWAVTVSPGMKANEEIRFQTEALKSVGITEVTEIEFTLRVYDSENWAEEDLLRERFVIHPLGEEAAENTIREAEPGDILLFDDENCTMIVTGFDPDNIWGYTLNVYLRNKTDKNLMFSINDAAVNGFMCDPFWAETVAAGKQSSTTISWMADAFEENGILEVESLTLPIRVYDSEDWTAEDFVNDTFTVNP